MALNEQIDSLEFEKVDFPYNRIEAELSTLPRLVSGYNSLVTVGGKLAKRGGTSLVSNSDFTKRCDRLIVYETLDATPKVYIVGSFYNSSSTKYEVYYLRLSGVSPAWTQIPDLRDIHLSTAPHEFVISRGLLYIKGFPAAASTEKLGTVFFDGSPDTPTTNPWGLLAPVTPVRIDAVKTILAADIVAVSTTLTVTSSSGFSTPFVAQLGFERIYVTNIASTTWTITRGYDDTTASDHIAGELILYRNWGTPDHTIKVELFWRYAFAYESTAGHISNISPYESNPDLLPSSTGPFKNQIPKVTISTDAFANTTEYPYIRIYRTLDGGGKAYFLKRISNTGASATITFEDKYLLSGPSSTIENDPVPDDQLNTAELGPSLTSNSPPPTVLAPLVTGTDTPVRCSNIVGYASRLWYAIGNVIFFSGQEETLTGIPEEAWPSGLKGNFYRVQYPVSHLVPTANALYAFTLNGTTYAITGNNLETFNISPVLDNCGAPSGQYRASAKFQDTVAILTHDYRIVLINNGEVQSISDPLYSDLTDSLTNSPSFDIKYFGDKEKEYLVVSSHVTSDTTLSRQWVYDFKKSAETKAPFWFTPWTVRATASISHRINETSAARKLLFYVWDQANDLGALVEWDTSGSVGSDYFPGGAVGFDFQATTNLFLVPVGNHVNTLRRPGLAPAIYDFKFERTLFSGDSEPQFFYFKDDFWTTPIALGPYHGPARRAPSISYRSVYYPVNTTLYRCAVRWEKPNSKELFEVQNFTIRYRTESGGGE